MYYQCARIYRFRTGTMDHVRSAVEATLLPSLAQQPGFVRYRFMTTADDRALSESVWETIAEAASADVVEGDWVRGSISSDLDGLPDLLIGPIEIEVGR
jgi:hypothetical protein